MISVLSIDFDYFIDASAAERDQYFLTGGEDIPREQLDSMWTERYAAYPQIARIGVIAEFDPFKWFLESLNLDAASVFVSETHRAIKQLIDSLPQGEQLMIVNVDFHHDFYHYFSGDDYCNCGNWLRRVLEERPTVQVRWIRRADSQLATLEGDVPFAHTTDLASVFREHFDYVFLCRSPEWSPPHLSSRYEELVWALFEARPKGCLERYSPQSACCDDTLQGHHVGGKAQ
ncbi:MAG: hypothetical protein ACOX53_10455 [Limnochordia bacterium]